MRAEPTSERLIIENYQSNHESYLIYLLHLATYKYSLGYAKGKKILDYGCGSGYGTALVSDVCSHIVGVDISPEAILHANSHFKAPNLSYLEIEPAEVFPLPFPNSSFDVVLSFQVIEHVKDVSAYLLEIERVLVPGGYALIATPDRSSRLFSFQKPWNMWHIREYTEKQLLNELITFFSNVEVLRTGGRRDVLQMELKRTKRLRWLLLPVTLPFIPESVRRASLRFIKLIRYNLFRRLQSDLPLKPDFDESVFSFSHDEEFSVDLLAIAQKKSDLS